MIPRRLTRLTNRGHSYTQAEADLIMKSTRKACKLIKWSELGFMVLGFMMMISKDDVHELGSNNSDKLKHARDHKIKNMKRYYQHLKIKQTPELCP